MRDRKSILMASLGIAMLAGLNQAKADSVTLHALMEDVPETHIIEGMLPEFQKETGIKVEFEKVNYGDMHDKLALTLQDDLTAKIADVGAKGVLIDISSLEIVDSFIGRTLANIASMAQVLDAQTVVVGMQPAVAITLVELGMSLPGIRTALNVESGMHYLQETAVAYESSEEYDGDSD